MAWKMWMPFVGILNVYLFIQKAFKKKNEYFLLFALFSHDVNNGASGRSVGEGGACPCPKF